MFDLDAAKRVALASALWLGAGVAAAQDLALVVVNRAYDTLGELPVGVRVAPLEERLSEAGFAVISVLNGERGALFDAARRFAREAPEAERLLVVLQGRFLTGGRDGYLLPVEEDEAMPVTILPRRGLSVSALLDVLDTKAPGAGVLMLALEEDETPVGPHLRRGPGRPRVNGTALLLTGEPEAAQAFLAETLTVPGATFEKEDAREAGLAARGPDDAVTFIPQERDEGDGRTALTEAAYWQVIRAFDTERAYVAYLDRFPEGQFVTAATERLAALRDPAYQARVAEADLSLTREDRRGVQEALRVLGYDPGGIDGLFGPATRRALAGWQEARGEAATGYLEGAQLAALSEEAARRRAEVEAAERDVWRQSGQGGEPAGLRAYLERYPEGRFAERAREALAAAEAANDAERTDAEAFAEATRLDRVPAYRRYIRENPDGAHITEARTRIRELRGTGAVTDPDVVDAEGRLELDVVTRSLIEGRLRAFGFDPGAVDGEFDDAARQAIRRYQESRGLGPTGYLDQDAVRRLLTDALR